jgi:hypothetical protein
MINPKVSLVISVCIVAWVLHDMMAPGEAMTQGVYIMNCVLLFASAMGAIGAVIRMRKEKS